MENRKEEEKNKHNLIREDLIEEMSVDWRCRPCNNNKSGGMTAAVFVLGKIHNIHNLV